MNFINRFSKVGRFIFLIGGFILVASLVFSFNKRNAGLNKGMQISDTNISLLTKKELVRQINDNPEYLKSIFLTLQYQNKEWKMPYNDLGISIDNNSAKNNGGLFSSTWDNISNYFRQDDILIRYDKKVVTDKLNVIKSEIDLPKKNAAIISKGDGIELVPHIDGKILDINKNLELIDDAIKNFNTNKILLVASEDKPEVTVNDLSDIQHELSKYHTTFNVNYLERTHNLKLASSRLNGVILKPNEIFSMDKMLKQRTINNGYKSANAYFNGEIVQEIGGGVCQITTTMYDAALLADLDIIEREQHTMRVGYVPPGFDAAISDSGIDLKFKNTKKYPIYIFSTIDGNKLIVKIFGKNEEPNKIIKLESQVQKIYPAGPDIVVVNNDMPSSYRKRVEASKDGCKATLYKKTYIDGKLVSSKIISHNTYMPLRGKVIVGSR